MNTFRICASILVSLVLTACGGGGSETESGAFVPAQAGSADIGPAGGSVTATFEGGATVTLIVPAKALAATTTIRIDPGTAPADVLAAMTMAPAGLQFAVPATLSIVLPAGSDPSDKLVTFGIGGVRVPVGAVDAATRTMVVDLPYLGVGPAAPASLSEASHRSSLSAARQGAATASTEVALELFVQHGDLTSAVTLWHQLVATLASDGSRDNAIEVQVGFTALLRLSLDAAPQTVKDQVAVDLTTWRNVDCTQLTTAISALNSFDFSADFAGYARRAADVLVFGRLTKDLFTLATQVHFIAPTACPALQDDIGGPVRPSFPSYINAATTALEALSPVDDFSTLLNTRLRQLIDFIASLQTFGRVDDLAAQVQTVAANQTVRLRAGAYTDCRVNHRQVKQQTLLVREIGDAGFEPLSPYDRSDLIADIQYCGMLIHWAVLDASDAVLQKGDAGGILPGVIVDTVPVTLSGAAKLVLSGPLSALNCPSGSNNEQLTFAAGPASGAISSVGTLTPGSDSGYLEVSDLILPTSQLDARSHPSGGTGNGQLVVQRTGSVCNTDFPDFTGHSALVNFTLNFNGVAITTSSLPDATVGSTYVAQMLSSGGTAPLTWSASGLPGGLNIDAATGLISGMPSTAGTSTVQVGLHGSDGSTTQKTLTLRVKEGGSRWEMTVFVECPSFGGTGTSSFSGSFILNEAGNNLSGSFAGLGVFNGIDSCFIDTRVLMNGTFAAIAQRNVSGDIIGMTNLVLVPSIDGSALGRPVCKDLEIDIPGPIEGTSVDVFGLHLLSQCRDAEFFGFFYSGLQLFKAR